MSGQGLAPPEFTKPTKTEVGEGLAPPGFKKPIEIEVGEEQAPPEFTKPTEIKVKLKPVFRMLRLKITYHTRPYPCGYIPER